MKSEVAKSAGEDVNSNAADKKEKEKKKKYRVNDELLRAFRYFDRNCECPPLPVALHTMLARFFWVLAKCLKYS